MTNKTNEIITIDDKLYHYKIEFSNFKFTESDKSVSTLVEIIYNFLKDNNINFMDIRENICDSTWKEVKVPDSEKRELTKEEKDYCDKYDVGCDPNSKMVQTINWLMINLITFERLSTEKMNSLIDINMVHSLIPTKYRLSSHIDLVAEYKATDVSMELYLENNFTVLCGVKQPYPSYFPLVGCYKGIYMDVDAVKENNRTSSMVFFNYMYAASWNFKSKKARQSITGLTNKKIHYVSLIDKDGVMFHQLGHNWFSNDDSIEDQKNKCCGDKKKTKKRKRVTRKKSRTSKDKKDKKHKRT